MKEQRLLVTMKDIQRHKVLKDVIDKKLKGTEAASILGIHPVHLSRLKTRLIRGGFEAMLRHPPPHPPNARITDTDRDKILKLRKKYYYDFNVRHFMDKLHDEHKIEYCYESIRKLLIKAKEHSPKPRRKVYRQRRRMPKAGLLVQMDSSQHRWLKHIKESWWLIATVDDATNEVAYARFFPKDTLFANMHVLRRLIEIKGLFHALYVDKASHFKTTRHGGIHYNMAQDQEETQIERALKELDINIIFANSPQAKGRIEVTFRLFQDRLIKEMRLAGVKDYDQANRFLVDKFLPDYSRRFTHQAESAYMSLPKDKNLGLVFCIKKERLVKNDNTLSIYGQTIQIPPSAANKTFAKSKVEACLLEDSTIYILHRGRVVAESKLSKNNKIVQKEQKIESLLNEREYVIGLLRPKRCRKSYDSPDRNHPWHAFRLKGSGAKRKLKLTF